MSLRDTIFSFPDRKRETISVKAWGGVKIEVRSFSAAAQFSLVEKAKEGGEFNEQWLSYQLILHSCYDPETGEKLFSLEDAKELAEKSPEAILEIAEAVSKLNNMTEKTQKKLEKNS